MRQWRLDGLNSLATRIAVTMVLAILLSVALTIALVIGYALERQRSPDGDRDFRVFVDGFAFDQLQLFRVDRFHGPSIYWSPTRGGSPSRSRCRRS